MWILIITSQIFQHSVKRITAFSINYRKVGYVKINEIPLNILAIGKKAKVIKLLAFGSKRRRFLDLGLIPNTIVEAVQISPVGDPKAFFIRGAVIALREEESSKIIVQQLN